jgi:hypothetical protein
MRKVRAIRSCAIFKSDVVPGKHVACITNPCGKKQMEACIAAKKLKEK